MIPHKNPVVGIDVAKLAFVIAIHESPKTLEFQNTKQGISQFIRWLDQMNVKRKHIRIALDSTGGCEHALWEALELAGFDVRQVPSNRIWAFTKSEGILAKTDAIDAKIIARFAHSKPGIGRRLPSETTRKLGVLIAKRRQVVKIRTMLKCQIKQHRDPQIIALDEEHIALLNRQIKTLESQILETQAGDVELAQKTELLRSIPGIGPVLAATLLGEFPELGQIRRTSAAALAGLAPLNHDSGKKHGKRFIKGGRKPVRDTLYQAALVASIHNPQLRVFAQRLKAKGKPHKQVMIAVARKLLLSANTVLKRNKPWVIEMK